MSPKTAVPKKDVGPLGFLRIDRRALAFGAMAFAAMWLSLPALPASAELATENIPTVQTQSFVASEAVADATVVAEADASGREAFTFSKFSLVQWPIRSNSPVGDGFGNRIPPCSGCSSYHKGVDFNPGNGTAVSSVADGVVTEVGNPSGGLGVYVVIQHNLEGKIVSTVYAHMTYGSLAVGVGDKVKIGQQVGTVGSTGQSTGPHLYFEVRVGGTTPVDPIPWLAANVNS